MNFFVTYFHVFFNALHFHQFFKNKELNHLYISVAVMTFGEDLISIFVPIYLYKLLLLAP